MQYETVQQTAARWGLSLRQTQKHLAAGRVTGAKKSGHIWLIPSSAKKPPDPRSQAARAQPKYLSCGLMGNIVPLLPHSAVQQPQMAAERAYLRGDYEAVKQYYVTVPKNTDIFLCAADIAMSAAMATGDYALYQKIIEAVQHIADTAPSQKDRDTAQISLVLSAVNMYAPSLVPEWMVKGDFSRFSADAFPMLVYLRTRYMQCVNNFEGMLALAQTALLFLHKENEVTLPDLYFTCLCACALYALGRMDEAESALSRAVALCESGGFIAPLSEYATALGGMAEIALKRCRPDFDAAVNKNAEITLKNWISFHNTFTTDHLSMLLTRREYQLVTLIKEGKAYKQIASQMCISTGRVKNMVSVVYAKLGIRKRADLFHSAPYSKKHTI